MKNLLLRHFTEDGPDCTTKIEGTEARIVRSGRRFGVFFPADIPADFFEDKLNSMTIRVGQVKERNGVLVSCTDPSLKEPFADACVRFLAPTNLCKIKADPFKWWNELKALFGNVLSDDMHYFLFAEFLTYLLLHKECKDAGSGIEVKWKSCAATHDIEMSDGSQHEVKSTVKRTESIITISSRFQMSVDPNTPFFIYFIRLEPERQDGFSIQDLCDRAVAQGCDLVQIEQVLASQGLTMGSPKRKIRFAVLEAKRYDVGTGPFPKFTVDSFRPECVDLFAAVENFTYEVNLSAVTCPQEDILERLKAILGK